MKKIQVILMCVFVYGAIHAQVKTFFGSGIDWAICMARFEDTLYTTMEPRVSWWFNFSEYYHVHFTDYFGLFIGAGIRNLGFIANYTDTSFTKRKYRVYAFKLPLGFKIGNISEKNGFFVLFGGDISIPLHYKEKWFAGKNKIEKISEWFSQRTELFMPSAFIGINFHKTTLRLHYYPMNFMNKNFSITSQGQTTKPYRYMNKSNLISIEIGLSLTNLKNKKQDK
ncbi:MAG: hypothetical protein N2Z72_03290 [Bacteroidales bacterium]|nr:hypothetical protein [Bacteroidales bacterium]